MVVNLNLLGCDVAEKRADVSWPLASSLCLFLLAVTFSAILYESHLFNSLYKKRITAEAELRSVESSVSEVNASFGDAEARLNGIEEVFDFLLGDLRVSEILPLLAVCAAEDAVVESLEVNVAGMTLFGKAKNEYNVLEIYKVLVSSGLFAYVDKLYYISDSGFDFSFTMQFDPTSGLDLGVTDDR